MSNKILNVVIFAVGAAIGSAVTWKLVKTKYQQLADEEIASVKEVYSRRNKEKKEDVTIVKGEISLEDYKKMLGDLKYGLEQEESTSEGKEEAAVVVDFNEPYVITPEEFGENEDYETVSWTYYADEILADEANNAVSDFDNTVGDDFFNHFGEYESDSVFIRNDKTKTDYEILLDLKTYAQSKATMSTTAYEE